ncbi:MAG: energy transducer TonB [Acidobacteriota bacterium]|nr:energy transducer TonB [Acidobacteriota bacterium]
MAGIVAAGTLPSALGDDRKMKNEVRPVYPELAKKMNVSGAVKVEIVITPAGAVKSAKALGGHPLLIESALDAVKKCRFEAAPAETTQVVTFNFKGNQ